MVFDTVGLFTSYYFIFIFWFTQADRIGWEKTFFKVSGEIIPAEDSWDIVDFNAYHPLIDV